MSTYGSLLDEELVLLEPESEQSESAALQPLYQADPDRVLRILAENQFEDPYLAFRELYANALDAVRTRQNGRIILDVKPERVVVEDNGPGLDDAGLQALTCLGASTRRGKDAIGWFGIGFASIFDPALGVNLVRFLAPLARDRHQQLEVRFLPHLGGGVTITTQPISNAELKGSRVEVHFDPARTASDRVSRVADIFEQHASYSGVSTYLNNVQLGKNLSDYIHSEVKSDRMGSAERRIVAASAVQGPVGVAAIDPSRTDCRVKAYLRGLYVCEIVLPRPEGRPWPRGVFGAVNAEGLDLVASRNGFIQDSRYTFFVEELNRLVNESAYRIVRHFEASNNRYSRAVLLDALRRGLKTAAPEVLVAEANDLFGSALVRSPLFEAWREQKKYSFEELVNLDQNGLFRALAYRPSLQDTRAGLIFKADYILERDIFRKLSGMRDMPAAARSEMVAAPGFFSRLRDRFLSGPRAEYSLFRRDVSPDDLGEGERRLIEALDRFMRGSDARQALSRLLPGRLPLLSFGVSRNTFGPLAAYRMGEIRFNLRHRTFSNLARHRDPDRAARGLLPVLAHELAHMCHELHDLDFYRTSRTILRALVNAAARQDARELVAAKGKSARV